MILSWHESPRDVNAAQRAIPPETAPHAQSGSDAHLDRAAAAGVATGAYIPELESLRGLAILLVFWFHIEGILFLPYARPATTGFPLQSLVRAGHTGVSLFFVLSAFLLSLPFLRARGRAPVSLRRYASRRALRILPLYWFAVAVGTVVTATGAADLGRAVPHMLFLSSVAGWWEAMPPFSDVWWSLGTEMQFYLLLPLLPLCLRSRAGRWIGAALLGGIAVLYGCYLTHVLAGSTFAGQRQLGDSIIGRAPQFVIGGAAAWIYLRWRERSPRAPAWWRNGGADLALAAVLALLALLLQWVIAGGITHFASVPYHAWHVIEAVLWASVVLLVLLAPLHTRALWSNRVLERLGLLSYSIYMWHLPIAWYVVIIGLRRHGVSIASGWTARGAAAALLVAALCYVVSELTYRTIERPFLTRKARIR
jgi:peptidoglycan/LPS O-acetylase OafA/YrhL